MAPEQIRGGDVGPATDVWAIGALLYRALSGREAAAVVPDAGGRAIQLPGPPPPLRASRRLPRPLRDAIARCLADDPAARPTLNELEAVLADVVGDDGAQP
jgi:serine/threonine-protein kinase